MRSRRQFLAAAAAVGVAGCLSDADDGAATSRSATRTPTVTNTATTTEGTSFEDRETKVYATTEATCEPVVFEGRAVELSDEKLQWIRPVEYEKLDSSLQRVADTAISMGIDECYPVSESTDRLIDDCVEQSGEQASAYLDETGATGLPSYVDNAYLSKDEVLYALKIVVMDEVESDGNVH
ncbi:hypothetical protein [Haloarchaeobius sp. DFWS5]|uniref:hypothetical protein n=1 Tax=Haloarchaeobius sp. DFWS5 TaxID=3446114 RepID=UPI003EBFC4CE